MKTLLFNSQNIAHHLSRDHGLDPRFWTRVFSPFSEKAQTRAATRICAGRKSHLPRQIFRFHYTRCF